MYQVVKRGTAHDWFAWMLLALAGFVACQTPRLAVFGAGPALPATQTSTLKGTVTDSAGAPIPDAYILIHWDSSGSGVGLTSNIGLKSDVVLKSGKDGAYASQLPPGFYDVFVSAMAFGPACRKVRTIVGKATMYNARLEADASVTAELGDRLSHKN
jgi:Carboxypeptidase regulatory-like domain